MENPQRLQWLRAVFTAILLSILGTSTPIFAGTDEAPIASNTPLPFTTVVPALEHQTGGKRIFQSIKNVYQVSGDKKDRLNRRIFLNQKLDLNLLGPGTNLSFVTDAEGKNWAFTFSNGRFEAETENGRISENTYPEKLQRQGKYPWPKDAEGNYLPGDLLTASNGPHSSMSSFMQKYLEDHGSRLPMIAGHVGVNMDGQAYIGYTSASVNGRLSRAQEDKTLSKIDGRALPANFRRALHSALSKAFRGRDIDQVVGSAPTSVEDITEKDAVNHYPNRRLIPNVYEQAFSSYGYLYQTMSEQMLMDYIGNLELHSITTIVTEIYLYESLGIPEEDFERILKAIENRLMELAQTEAPDLKITQRNLPSHSRFGPYFEGLLLKKMETAPLSTLRHLLDSRFEDKSSTLDLQNILMVLIKRGDTRVLKRVFHRIMEKPWFDEDFKAILDAFDKRVSTYELVEVIVGIARIESEYILNHYLPRVMQLLEDSPEDMLFLKTWLLFFKDRPEMIKSNPDAVMTLIENGSTDFHRRLVIQLKTSRLSSLHPDLLDQFLARIVELNDIEDVIDWLGLYYKTSRARNLQQFKSAYREKVPIELRGRSPVRDRQRFNKSTSGCEDLLGKTGKQ